MRPTANDPYLYPGTNVLINIGNIRDKDALDRFEADATAMSIIALRRKPLTGPFDITRLQETHRRIFGRVYPWAGEFRKDIGMLAKNRSGFLVAYGPSVNIPFALPVVFAALHAEDSLRDLNVDVFARRLAFFYSELDAIHPFREGNSRTLRVFTSDLAQAAGHSLDWSRSLSGIDFSERQE